MTIQEGSSEITALGCVLGGEKASLTVAWLPVCQEYSQCRFQVGVMTNCHLEAVVLDFAYTLESPGVLSSPGAWVPPQVIDGQSSQLTLTHSWTENHCLQSTGRTTGPRGVLEKYKLLPLVSPALLLTCL